MRIRTFWPLAAVFSPLILAAVPSGAALTGKELESVGHRVWQNECAGTRDGLTSWNAGENFASLGIGHFIWYPQSVRGPFEESFPRLMEFFSKNGVVVPAWMQGPCPWNSRAAFQSDFRSPRMSALRDLLASTVSLQSRFLALRMNHALPKMLAAAPQAERTRIRNNFQRLSASASGTFALIDYVNFKGEGTLPSERYQGEGWGLLQVLSRMPAEGPATAGFSTAAASVLERRVRNAPRERNETRWLPGWKSRVRAYVR